MNTDHTRQIFTRRCNNRRGVALIMVLGILVLVSALIIAFLASVKTELVTSQSYAYGASTQQLADSAVNMAIAMVQDATKGEDGNTPLAWASQPGMIRTYDTNGNPDKFYKLYSSDRMIVDGASFSGTAELPPANWDSNAWTGVYTDLNSPVTVSSGTATLLRFPIIDPRAKSAVAGQSLEGFDYQNTVDGVVLPGTNADDQRLPMPVRWLYVLQDGTIAIPISSSNGVVTFDPSNMPTQDNPIVGRIAFWTDDETCKVNINTASEGTFWDRPWANTETEQHFATAIPAQNEFQRFPGHPAKTCLSTVLESLLPSPNPDMAWAGSGSGGTNAAQLKAYYDLVPRVADGGTHGGTVNETDASGNPNASFQLITPDQDRLYASVDELLYKPTSTTPPDRDFSISGSGSNDLQLDNAFLEKAKFFLTAHNRSPELNLFGKPRITLWPLQTGTDTSSRNVKDRLIAFCSTINNLPYYFQRFNTYSANPRTTVSGATAASSQSAVADWQNVQRNQDLYRYLDQMTSANIPGFGGSFAAKYPNTRLQVLTEMFDMIRSGVNSYNTTYNYVPTYLQPGAGQVIPIQPGNGTQGFGRTTTIVGAAVVFFRTNPANCTTTGTTAGSPLVTSTTSPDLRTALNPSGIVMTPAAQIGASLILNPYTPSPGLPPLNPNLQYVVSGLGNLRISTATTASTPLNFPSGDLRNTTTARAEFSGGANAASFFGVVTSLRYAMDITGANGDGTKAFGSSGASDTDAVSRYAFCTTTGVTVGANDTLFNFEGGDIVVKVYAGSDTSRSHCLQTINMHFPPAQNLLIPTVDPTVNGVITNYPSYNNQVGEGSGATLSKTWRKNGLVRFHPIPDMLGNGSGYWWKNSVTTPLGVDSNGQPVTYWVQNVARGVEADPDCAAKGDLRVYAALTNVPSSYFRACRAPDGSAAYDFQALDAFGHSVRKYPNVQTLRDEGQDGGGLGGFGFDNSSYIYGNTYNNALETGPYPHFPVYGGGSQNGVKTLLISTFANGFLVPQNKLAAYAGSNDASFPGTQEYRGSAKPACANGLVAALISNGAYGDWDNMTGLTGDGAFINKPDEGNSSTVSHTANTTNVRTYFGTTDIAGGYFSSGFYNTSGTYKVDDSSLNISTFSPNRQVSSAVMFGSLPTGINPADSSSVQPWQTLLFCANPAGGTNHPGFGTPLSGPPYTLPPDSLMLDLFTMPIVEPYAISEPFSTAGKVNMNYQIMPFSYIRRDTGVRAVLKSTRIMAIPQSLSTISSNLGASYKDGTRCTYELRYNINPDETVGTLRGFENRFDAGDIFRSAAEICGIYLVPQLISPLSPGVAYPPGSTPPASYAATASWWDNFMLTGDNTREFPYGDIYARLTTKSNTYTVHVRVQTLKKNSTTPAGQWVEGQDVVVGEYRGSSAIERYIDANDSSLPDFAQSGAPNAESYYKIHIINTKKFQF